MLGDLQFKNSEKCKYFSLSQSKNMLYTMVAWSHTAWQWSGMPSHVQYVCNSVPLKCSFMSHAQLKCICPACQPFFNICSFPSHLRLFMSSSWTAREEWSSCEQSPEASGAPYLVVMLPHCDNRQFTLWLWNYSTSSIFILAYLARRRHHSDTSFHGVLCCSYETFS